MTITVQPATVGEWPEIESLRRAYFEARNQPIQRRGDGTHWMVALDENDRVVGCYSYEDVPDLHQRWALDFYRRPGKVGRAACAAMWRHLRAMTKYDDLRLAATVAPDNAAQLGAMERRGFRPVGIILLLEEDVPCPQPSPFR